MKPIEINRKTVEKIELSGGRIGWAHFTLDPTGSIDIQSDWGNYSDRWPRPDDDFKKFLVRCDDDYIKRNFHKALPDHLYAEKTEANIKTTIMKQRQLEELTADEARTCWEELEHVDFESINGFMHSLHHLSFPSGLWGEEWYLGVEEAETGYPPQLNCFFEHVWPEFIKVLKSDLESKVVKK